MGKNNFRYDDIFTQEDKNLIIQDYIENGLSIKEVGKKYNIRSHSYIQKVLKGYTRNVSQANKIAHLKNPQAFKHSEETKQKIRENRLRYMKEHPEDTAWRKRNKPSYPEECFIKFLQEKGYDKAFLIEREKSVFPYFIDFAFTDIKLAIEIDGSQHLEIERQKKDVEKDKLLNKLGWKVLRISENLVKTDWSILEDKINYFIDNDNITFEKVGIVKAPKTHQKVERFENGLSKKQMEQHYNQRKIKNRPTKEVLLNEIQTMSFVNVGKKYKVTDNTIRDWCKYYGLPYRKKDIKHI